MKERKIRNQFPRTADIPVQSPKYWAKEKDRYIRQLLISDIEAETGRELVVYFSRLDQAISETDADDISEVLLGVESKDVDILLHTPGGLVDSVEKFVSVLRLLALKYRVIVPSFAKSGGTLIALTAQQILMGVNSELGPVDPQIDTPEYRGISAEYVASDTTQPPILQSIAKANIARGKKLAEKYLHLILNNRGLSP
jgi:ClpP class serine protease